MQSPIKTITHFATTLLMKPKVSRNSKFNTHKKKNTTCTTKCTYTLNSSNITKNSWLCASQQNCSWLNDFVHWTMGLTSLWKALRGLNNYSARYQENSLFHLSLWWLKKRMTIKSYFQIIFTEVFHHQYPALSSQTTSNDKYAHILQNTLPLNFYLQNTSF